MENCWVDLQFRNVTTKNLQPQTDRVAQRAGVRIREQVKKYANSRKEADKK